MYSLSSLFLSIVQAETNSPTICKMKKTMIIYPCKSKTGWMSELGFLIWILQHKKELLFGIHRNVGTQKKWQWLNRKCLQSQIRRNGVLLANRICLPFCEHISLLYQTPSETEETKRPESRAWTPLADRNRQLQISGLERDDVEQPGGENWGGRRLIFSSFQFLNFVQF